MAMDPECLSRLRRDSLFFLGPWSGVKKLFVKSDPDPDCFFISAVTVLQASFAYNKYYCTKAKPAANLPSSNPVKRIQKNHIQSNPIIQSADSEIMSRQTWPRVIWCISMTSQGARQPDAIKHLSNIWTDQR